MEKQFDEVYLQLIEELKSGSVEVAPMLTVETDKLAKHLLDDNVLNCLSDNDEGKLLLNVLTMRGDQDPCWWRTPLGKYTAACVSSSDDKLLSQKDAARILAVTPGTVAQLVKRGRLESLDGKPYRHAVLHRMLSKPGAGRPKKNQANDNGKKIAKPILKWAGGKTQMLDSLLPCMPEKYGKYIEPFFGGGALFFALKPQNAVISDSNPELVNLYTQVRDDVETVIELLHGYENTKECFLATRALDWQKLKPSQAAARMIYLNKTCYNGLYRVNKKGGFNTPFAGYKNPNICDEATLREASKVLQGTTIVCGDYKDVLSEYAEPGDFVFLDPPYIPVSKNADFKRYTKEQFSDENHRELAAEFARLHQLGCYEVLTNSNHPLVHELYGGFEVHVVETKRYVSCHADSRHGEDTIVIAQPKRTATADVHKIDRSAEEQIALYPATRFMGSKSKLLPELWNVVSRFDFGTVVDLFSGSGVVSYMFKAHGKRVFSNDYMAMSATFTKAMVENNSVILPLKDAENLLQDRETDGFVASTFKDLYYMDEENHQIDVLRTGIKSIEDPYRRAIAMSALIRACVKKRPRGIFTYTGHRYDDGRKDLKKSLSEQFLEAVEAINAAVFDNHQNNISNRGDALEFEPTHPDLVYMDPPYYSPLSDNEYVRRYHFVEGLACDWQGVEMQEHTKTKKFKSYPTPFTSRAGAADAFDALFERFRDSVIVVSYSSNSEPTKDEMLEMLGKYKTHVEVVPVDYRYSFGTQHSGKKIRNKVEEYFFVGW